MEPYGDETEEAFYEAFAEQARAFEAGGADAVIVETMMAIEECCVAVRAVRETTGLACLASFTFDPQPGGGFASMMGVTPERFAEEAAAAGAQIIGVNCGTGPDHMTEVVRRLRAATDLPLIAMPNAGMPELVDGVTVFPEPPEEMASKVGRLLDAGAQIIGGCCGTTPAHIAAMARAMRALRPSAS
jgi:5-methyltetrahydrofolate--homocysteine methyltransferase